MLARACWISNDCSASLDILRYYSAHSDDGPFADSKRLIAGALFQHSSRSNVDAIFNDGIAVDADSWRKGNVISDNAVMRNIGVKVGMEMPPNLNI